MVGGILSFHPEPEAEQAPHLLPDTRGQPLTLSTTQHVHEDAWH